MNIYKIKSINNVEFDKIVNNYQNYKYNNTTFYFKKIVKNKDYSLLQKQFNLNEIFQISCINENIKIFFLIDINNIGLFLISNNSIDKELRSSVKIDYNLFINKCFDTNSNNFKKINTIEFHNKIFKKQISYPNFHNNVNDFDISNENIIETFIYDHYSNYFNSNIHIEVKKDHICINDSKITYENIKYIIIEIVNSNINFDNHKSIIQDSKLINELNNSLIKDFKHVIFIFNENYESIFIKNTEININKFADEIIEKTKNFNIKYLYNTKLTINNDWTISIFNFINSLILHDNKYYYLYNGKWYEFNNEYISEIKSFYEKVKKEFWIYDTNINIKNFKNEYDFNTRLANELNAKLYDKKFINIDKKIKFELCDILDDNDNYIDMYFVKVCDHPSSFGHLLNQLLYSYSYIKKYPEKIPEIKNTEIYYKLIIIMSKKKLELSFFEQFMLYNFCRNNKNINFKIKFLKK